MIVDHYAVLNVPKTADVAEIKKAYRQLVLKTHPDRILDKEKQEAAKDEFQKVQAAYEILGDASKRQRYDDQVRRESLRKRAEEDRSRGGRYDEGPRVYEMYPGGSRSSYDRPEPRMRRSWESEEYHPNRSHARKPSSYEREERDRERRERERREEEREQKLREQAMREKILRERQAKEARDREAEREVREKIDREKREKDRILRERASREEEKKMREMQREAREAREREEREKERERERERERDRLREREHEEFARRMREAEDEREREEARKLDKARKKAEKSTLRASQAASKKARDKDRKSAADDKKFSNSVLDSDDAYDSPTRENLSKAREHINHRRSEGPPKGYHHTVEELSEEANTKKYKVQHVRAGSAEKQDANLAAAAAHIRRTKDNESRFHDPPIPKMPRTSTFMGDEFITRGGGASYTVPIVEEEVRRSRASGRPKLSRHSASGRPESRSGSSTIVDPPAFDYTPPRPSKLGRAATDLGTSSRHSTEKGRSPLHHDDSGYGSASPTYIGPSSRAQTFAAGETPPKTYNNGNEFMQDYSWPRRGSHPDSLPHRSRDRSPRRSDYYPHESSPLNRSKTKSYREPHYVAPSSTVYPAY